MSLEIGGHCMQSTIIALLNKYGYFGIFSLIAVENIFPPIPSEVILTFGGFMTTYTSMNLWLVILFATLGSLVGAIVLYYIGRILNKERLIKIVRSKVGKILCLKEEDIEKADHWFDTKGNKTVFFCRFVPIVRSLISIPAGMSGMNMFKFLVYTTFGSLIWNFVLVFLGSKVGSNFEKIVDVIDKYSYITLTFLVILCIVFIVFLIRRKKKEQK